MKIATPFFSLRGPDCIRSFRWFAAFLVVLSSSLLALAAQERTSCKKSYDDTVKMLDDDFDRTIASIKKNGRLNRMDVSDVLARMREQHQAALERQKGLYDDCLKRAAAADAAAGTEIDNETNAIQEETNKMMRNRRTLAKSGDPRFLKSKKEEISKEAAELDNRALAAVTRGDYKQARAYTRKAQALRSQAQQLGFVAEELQTANHNNAKDDADGMAKQVGLRQPDEESKPQTGEGDPFLRELRAMIAKQESLLTTELKNVQAIASKWTQDVLGEKISDLRKRVAVTEQKAHTLNDAETVFEMLKVAALGKQLAEAYEDI